MYISLSPGRRLRCIPNLLSWLMLQVEITYIVIDEQAFLLFRKSSVWPDTRDASSWDRNTADLVSVRYLTLNYRYFQRKQRNFFKYTFLHICYRLWECSVQKSVSFSYLSAQRTEG